MFFPVRTIFAIALIFALPIVAHAQTQPPKAVEANGPDVPATGKVKVPNVADKDSQREQQAGGENAVMVGIQGRPLYRVVNSASL